MKPSAEAESRGKMEEKACFFQHTPERVCVCLSLCLFLCGLSFLLAPHLRNLLTVNFRLLSPLVVCGLSFLLVPHLRNLLTCFKSFGRFLLHT